MHKVLVLLDRDKAEKLTSMLDVHVRPVYFAGTQRQDGAQGWNASQLALCDELADGLRSALNQQVEERKQFTVAGTNADGVHWRYPQSGTSLTEARKARTEVSGEEWNSNVRLQSRTITTYQDGYELIGPWVDVEEGDGA